MYSLRKETLFRISGAIQVLAEIRSTPAPAPGGSNGMVETT
jgi:hypothetical protein